MVWYALRAALTATSGSPHRGRVTFFVCAKKLTKESAPPIRAANFAVPCAPRSARGLTDSTSLCCGQRAVPTAPRKISGPDPRRPAVLGATEGGKTLKKNLKQVEFL